jgi:glyoxylase-like metal-dependent hydrolase (beta-lactamase superfamily II)
MEIAPGIHHITCTFGNQRMIFAYLLVGESASMLVDTGCKHNPAQDILPYMQSIGFDPARLTYVLITHSDVDHQGGNAPMNLDRPWIESADALVKGRYSQFERDHGVGYGEAGKAGIYADLDCCPMDMTLEGGETFRLSPDWTVEAIHTPGHTWGHLAILDPRSRTLVSGEASMSTNIPMLDWSPAMPPTYCYVDTYISTQERLMGMDIDLLASAHWTLQRGSNMREFIRESKNYVLHVESRLLELAKSHPFTLRQAIDELSPSLGTWNPAASIDFAYGMTGNLDRLTRRGVLTESRDGENHVVWSLS